jgi:hypothetical protein
MSTALIMVEGVLGEHSVVHGFHPIPEGVRLARALRGGYKVCLATTQADSQAVEFWLRINGMSQPSFYDELLDRRPEWADLDDSELQACQAKSLRTAGGDVGLVVSADPRALLAVTEMGLPCVFFINPGYRWAEYRPDKRRLPRAWADIENEMTRQVELKATDPRLLEMEEA